MPALEDDCQNYFYVIMLKLRDLFPSKERGKSKSRVTKERLSPFNPKQARRFNFDDIEPDDDTWQEKVVHIENETSTSEIRSYFKSKLTGHCVWDEPPTGATQIIYVSDQ